MAEPRTLDEQMEWERDYYLRRKDKDGNFKVDKIGNKKVETLRDEYQKYEEEYVPNEHLSDKHKKLAKRTEKADREEKEALLASRPETTVVTFQTTADMILPPPNPEKSAVTTAKEQAKANQDAIEKAKEPSENPPKS